jgi:uncharacterized protein (TIGR02453 family)
MKSEIFFTPDFNQFFIELAANNHKDWFDVHRKRYETSIKKPFEIFVQTVIDEVRVYEPEVKMKAGDAIFRINRDIRFSKDKSPYKLNRSAHVSASSKSDVSHSGMYFELGPEKVMVAGGAYLPEREQLQNIRSYIAANMNEWTKTISDAEFVKTTGGLQGESQKRITDIALNELAKKYPVLLQKQFYYSCDLPADIITSPDLLEILMARYTAAFKFNKFLQKAIN